MKRRFHSIDLSRSPRGWESREDRSTPARNWRSQLFGEDINYNAITVEHRSRGTLVAQHTLAVMCTLCDQISEDCAEINISTEQENENNGTLQQIP